VGVESEMGVKGDAEDLGSFCKGKRDVVDGDVRMEVGEAVFVGGGG